MRISEEARLVAEHRSNFASISIYRRLRQRVLSWNAAIQSSLADLHDVGLSCPRDGSVMRLALGTVSADVPGCNPYTPLGRTEQHFECQQPKNKRAAFADKAAVSSVDIFDAGADGSSERRSYGEHSNCNNSHDRVMDRIDSFRREPDQLFGAMDMGRLGFSDPILRNSTDSDSLVPGAA